MRFGGAEGDMGFAIVVTEYFDCCLRVMVVHVRSRPSRLSKRERKTGQ
jgi:hypothetical protein